MTTLHDIATAMAPNNAAIHELAQQADSLLLDIQNQRGHNGCDGSWHITAEPRTTGGNSMILMFYIAIHNISDQTIDTLARRLPRYDQQRSKPDELLYFECRNSNEGLAIWINLVDDTDTGENAA